MSAKKYKARSRSLRRVICSFCDLASLRSYTSLLSFSLLIMIFGSAGCVESSTNAANSDARRQQRKMPPAAAIPDQLVDEMDVQTDNAIFCNAKPAVTASTDNQDWRQFRGPNSRSEVATDFPLRWDIDKGVLWKRGLPGRGASSPIVSGDRIFLTAYDGYGLTAENTGDSKDLRHHLLCLDRVTGRPLWQREMTGTKLKQKMNPELARHGFASSTAVTDGENVFAFFGVTGVFAFDKYGNSLWQRNVGLNKHYFGSSASPILHEDLLIVNASIESNRIYALDKKTGKAVWEIPEVNECWSTPVIGKSQAGRTEMIVSCKNHVSAYDPKTGTKLWTCAGIQDYVVSVPIVVDGVCYLTGGKQKQTMAIRLGGDGQADDRKIWEIKKIGTNVSSPVFKDGRLFIFHDSGIVQVLDAATGDVLNRHRTATRTRPFASPLVAGEHIYMPFQDAGVSVFTTDEECKEVAVNSSNDEPLMASIVPDGDRLLIRSDKYLTCVSPVASEATVTEWTKPDDHEVIDTIEPFNIDPKKGWSRRYLGYLTSNFDQASRHLLIPYLSVITDEQTEEAREIILGEKPKYDALRDQFEALRWEELSTPSNDIERFRVRWQALESKTNKLNNATRILVKKLFPKEQLQQHMDDAKAGISHLPPKRIDKKDVKKPADGPDQN